MSGSNRVAPRRWYLSPGFMMSRLRERGLIWCVRAALDPAYRRVFRPGRPGYNLHNTFRFLVNLFALLSNKKPRKVILGVWDYKTLPWSIGDLLVFIETLSVLKLKHGADRVDVCVVCDSQNPAGNRGYKNINTGNFRYHLFDLLPLIGTSPYLGSVFQFDSRTEFYSFLRQSINKYEIYPPVNKQLAETYNFYGGATLKEVQDFYREHGFIPHLNIDDYHLSWAYNFYRTRADGLLPIVVSLKWHPYSRNRSADRHVWLGFFDICQTKFPKVVFIVIGRREEVFEELRDRSNIIIAKDYGSTLTDDCALIRTCMLYMGMESGISIIAVFSDVPYLLFGREEVARKALKLKLDSNFEFATQYQKAYYASSFIVTSESLLSEFSNLYNQLDIDKWRKKASAYKVNHYSFPI